MSPTERPSQPKDSARRQARHARRQPSDTRGFITRRWIFLGMLLVLSLLAAVYVANDNESEAAVVPEMSRQNRPQRVQATDAMAHNVALPAETYPDVIDRSFQRPAQQEVKDVFAPHSWYVPPAPIAVAASVPTAPPLPFVYLGKLLEDGKLTIFLARQDKNFTVREGDLIDDTYRVDAIKGTVMELTYIPLNIRQTLLIGEKN